MERLLSEKHLAQNGDRSRGVGADDSPPPKAAFWLLDRPMPASGKGLNVGDVPNVLGELYLYGSRPTGTRAGVRGGQDATTSS